MTLPVATTLIRFDWYQLTRSRSFWQLTALLVIVSAYAAFYGRIEVVQQQQKITTLQHDIDSSLQVVRTQLATQDTVAAWHYDDFLFALHANRPDEFAALAFGQRDLHKFAVSITTGTYFYNKYATGYQNKTLSGEIVNPQKQLAGHLDLSFVLVFLLPLYFILLGYNLLSSEKEGGTLALLAVQGVRLADFVLVKLAIRCLLTGLVGTALVGMTMGIIQAPIDNRLGYVLLTVWLYVGCWAGITGIVIALRRSSGFNALTLVSGWLLLCVAIPATITALSTVTATTHAKTALTRAVQKANARVFTTPKPALATQFYRAFPAYNNVPRDTFPDGWYNPRWVRAMHLLLDQEVKPYYDTYQQQLAQRIALADGFDYSSPAVLTQSVLNRLSASDMPQMLAYDTSMYEHFALWRDYLDYRIFLRHNTLTKEDVDHLPHYTFRPVINFQAIHNRLLLLGLIGLILAGLAGWLLRADHRLV